MKKDNIEKGSTPFAQTYFHGTKADLEIGDLIEVGFNSNYGQNKNAKVRFRDFWNISFADADVVYFYLMPHIYPKLEAKLKKELRPGTKIIVYAFPFPEWKPTKIDKETDQPTIYLYIV